MDQFPTAGVNGYNPAMSSEPSPILPSRSPPWLLRRTDQVIAAALIFVALAAMVGWYAIQGGFAGRLVELEREEPLRVRFAVDINTAQWPEISQFPEIGETLARRIVESREKEGPFLDHQDLARVRGIGPKTLEQIKPYLCPIHDGEVLAGQ